MDINKHIQKAQKSKFHLWKLNRMLWMGIPFNKPHRFKILELSPNSARVSIPYRKSNLNHIKTIHACAMATCAEYTSGLVLGSSFSFKQYRLIMREINANYHYQGKMEAYCIFHFEKSEQQKILNHLEKEDACNIQVKIKCLDIDNNHLSTIVVTWQIKPWSKTKEKLA